MFFVIYDAYVCHYFQCPKTFYFFTIFRASIPLQWQSNHFFPVESRLKIRVLSLEMS